MTTADASGARKGSLALNVARYEASDPAELTLVAADRVEPYGPARAVITFPASRYGGCRGPAIRRRSDGGRHAGLHRLRVMAEVACCCRRLSWLGTRVRTRRHRALARDTHRVAVRWYQDGWRPLRIDSGCSSTVPSPGDVAVWQQMRRTCGWWLTLLAFAAAATHSLAAQVLP